MSNQTIEKSITSLGIDNIVIAKLKQNNINVPYINIINNTKSKFWLIFCNYIFSLIIFYMIYTLIYLDMVTVDTYWLGYLITMIFQLIMCIILTLLDKKIKQKYFIFYFKKVNKIDNTINIELCNICIVIGVNILLVL